MFVLAPNRQLHFVQVSGFFARKKNINWKGHAAAFLFASLALLPTLFQFSGKLLRREYLLGLLLFRGAGRSAVAAGMTTAACFGAVAMAGVGERKGF